MLPELPADMPSFLGRFGRDEQCRDYLFRARWPEGFRCAREECARTRCYRHRQRLVYECAECGKQHSLLAGTIFEQTKTGLAKWFLAIFLVTSSKGGIAAAELKRQLGFRSDQTAWTWLHKIRRAMVDPERVPLAEPVAGAVQTDESYLGAPKPGKRGRGAAGKAIIAGAVETRLVEAPKKQQVMGDARQPLATERKLQLGRARLCVISTAGAASLEPFLTANVAPAAVIRTDGAKAYQNLPDKGFVHEPKIVSKAELALADPLGAVHLVFGHVKRWLLGTHHGGQSRKHLQRYLDEFVFRFNRRRAKSISHRFARLIGLGLKTKHTPYWQIVGRKAPNLKLVET
jgi:transposase-like protein